MSIAVRSHAQSRALTAWNAVIALGRLIRSRLRRRAKAGQDTRALQRLPNHVLADIGLERIEVMSVSEGKREIWIVPHRDR